MNRKRKPEDIFRLNNFNINTVIDLVDSNDAVSVKLLKQYFLHELLQEAKRYSYTPEEEYVGSGNKQVIQQMETFKDFKKDSLYVVLAYLFQMLLDYKLSGISTYPFESKLEFNSYELIRYKKGSRGITPHRDGLRYRNLICIFNIAGSGRFFTCEDRAGTNPVEFDTSPGNVIIMRAPGFMNSDRRPFHFVRDITEERYVFVLRQDSKKE